MAVSAPALAFASAVAALAAAADLAMAAERAGVTRFALLVLRSARRAAAAEEPEDDDRLRLAVVVAVALFASGWLVGGLPAAAALIVGAPALSGAWLKARRRRHAAAVHAGAPAAARAIASSIGAGHGVRAAIVEAAAEAEGAARAELARAARALELGEPTDAVLHVLRERAGSGPWDTLTAAIMLQRDAGGDLATLLRDLAIALEDAERARRDARAATAQSRLTAWIVAGLPAGAALLAELGSPGFLAGLLADPLSALLTLAAVAIDVAAIVTVRRLARVRPGRLA